jgi:hypothetical protein
MAGKSNQPWPRCLECTSTTIYRDEKRCPVHTRRLADGLVSRLRESPFGVVAELPTILGPPREWGIEERLAIGGFISAKWLVEDHPPV